MIVVTKDTINVMLTSGFGDVYTIHGIYSVDRAQHSMALANTETINCQIDALKKERESRISAGNITQNQLTDLQVKIDALKKLRFDEWQKVLDSGQKIEYVEFNQSEFY